MQPAEPMASRAGALGRVWGKGLGVQVRLAGGIRAGARIEHPQKVREGGDAAHRRPRRGRATLLLQGDRGGHSLDLVHLRHAHLVEQPARVRRNAFQVAALGLGVEGREGQGGFARARDPGEHHQGVPRNVDVHVLQIVLAGAAHPHEPGRRGRAYPGRLRHPIASWIVKPRAQVRLPRPLPAHRRPAARV